MIENSAELDYEMGREGRGYDPLRLYLDDIGKHRLLTKEEEAELYELIEEGRAAMAALTENPDTPEEDRQKLEEVLGQGLEARTRFINSNLRLVVRLAKKFQNEEMELLDLIQEGNKGLEHAVDKFDGRKGFKFSTYATWWIKQAIVRGIHQQKRMIRVPSNEEERLRILQRTTDDLTVELKRKPTYEEVAERIGSTALEVAKLDARRFRINSVLSLDKTYGEGEGALLDVVAAATPNEGQSNELELRKEIMDGLERILGERPELKEIIMMRFGIGYERPHSQKEVAAYFNLSPGAIGHREKAAMQALRRSRFFGELKEYLA